MSILCLISSSGVRTLPHNAKTHYNYANYLKDIGEVESAKTHYQTALRYILSPVFNGQTLPSLKYVGKWNFDLICDLDLICEKHFRIIFDYTSTCTIPDHIYHYSLYPHLPSAHNNLGTLLNDTMAAEVHYEAALKITPDHKGAMINLGTSLMWIFSEILLLLICTFYFLMSEV